ncbi:CocE/NonD family hydrolase C-terminal non-catalytic domain-containing protein [Georgenia sp. H159]|uniref:CocE/NonD family hydrolase C-terminal non-catalytic domain-containing protein n=1 Tax=Georgenia sp. H159 TaxID=3076115 RepID=UPI002D78F6B8|nr:CocE/NonD family hydrolase C-terminal non-catalytic domain-containing protein [Georgenia sp. H159]
MEPGRSYRVQVPLNGIANSFPQGHRLRLSISTSYWPLVWPAPEAATVTVRMGSAPSTCPSVPRAPRTTSCGPSASRKPPPSSRPCRWRRVSTTGG